MADLIIEPATLEDADQLAREMRAVDRREVIAANGQDVAGTIRLGVRMSLSSFAVRSPRGLVGIFGCVASSPTAESASPWFLATPLIARYSRTLGVVSKRYIEEMSRLFPLLTNHIDARNKSAIRLIEWLGFTLQEAEPYGTAGLPFHRFEMRRD